MQYGELWFTMPAKCLVLGKRKTKASPHGEVGYTTCRQTSEKTPDVCVCKAEEIKGAVELINHLGKACFIRGLHNERIQTIVRSRGESILLSQGIETSLEEGARLSVREKSGATGPLLRCHKCSKLGHRLISVEAVRNFLILLHGRLISLLR